MKQPLFATLSLCLLLMACAHPTPQKVNIAPELKLDRPVYGQGRIIKVIIEDAREQQNLGYYSDEEVADTQILAANDVNAAVLRASQRALIEQGFIINDSSPAAAILTLIIDDISYKTVSGAVSKDVHLSAKIKAVAKAGDKSYSSRYNSNSQQRILGKPGIEKNTQLLNKILSDTLARVFKDPKLKNFLQKI